MNFQVYQKEGRYYVAGLIDQPNWDDTDVLLITISKLGYVDLDITSFEMMHDALCEMSKNNMLSISNGDEFHTKYGSFIYLDKKIIPYNNNSYAGNMP